MGKSNGLRSLPASFLDFDSAEQITVQDVVATTPSPTLPTTSSPLSPPSTLPLTKATCQWSFSRYESSAFELEWFKLIQADRMCTNVCNDGLLFVDAHANQTFAVLRLAHQITLRLPHAFADYALFSRLHYTLTCPDASRNKVGVQLIEPLYGILRDPCDRFCNGKGHCPSQLTNRIGQGQSKAHMILLGDAPFKVAAPGEDAFASEQGWEVGRGFIAPWHCRSVEPCTLIKRGLFFDLGAALFGGWHGAVVAGDKDGAASQAFLYGRYHLRNVTITNLYSMELTGYSPSDVFSQMPADLIPALHWMNVPVSDEVGNKLNPLTTLKALRQADNHDLTVIKLDIDAWTIENALVDQLLADTKGEFGIVDEFHYGTRRPLRRET